MRAERLWFVLGGLVAVLIAFVGYFLLISPQNDETDSLRTQQSTVDSGNDKLQQNVRTLTQQNLNINQYLRELQKLRSALPSSSSGSDFLREVQQVANDNGVSLVTTTSSDPQPVTAAGTGTSAAPGGLYSSDITLTANGSAENLQAFVNVLQNKGDRAVLIVSSNIKGTSSDKSIVGSANLTLTLKIFFAPTAATTGKAS